MYIHNINDYIIHNIIDYINHNVEQMIDINYYIGQIQTEIKTHIIYYINVKGIIYIKRILLRILKAI